MRHVFLCLLALVFPTMAHADWAFAFGTYRGGSSVGWITDSPTREAAKRGAINACLEYGPNCKVIAHGEYGCAAVATPDNGRRAWWSWTENGDVPGLHSELLRTCHRESGRKCTIRGTACEAGTFDVRPLPGDPVEGNGHPIAERAVFESKPEQCVSYVGTAIELVGDVPAGMYLGIRMRTMGEGDRFVAPGDEMRTPMMELPDAGDHYGYYWYGPTPIAKSYSIMFVPRAAHGTKGQTDICLSSRAPSG